MATGDEIAQAFHPMNIGTKKAKKLSKSDDVIKSVCEDEELQPIECEKHGSCKNCPHYKPVL